MQATIERLRQRREELKDEGGFTLIELLIVIVILGILAAIVVFAVQNLTGTSAQASCQSDLQTVDHAVQAYYAENTSTFPTTVAQMIPGVLHTNPTNGNHYTIEMDKNVTDTSGKGTGPWTQAANAGGKDGQVDVLASNDGKGNWASESVYTPANANAVATACNIVK